MPGANERGEDEGGRAEARGSWKLSAHTARGLVGAVHSLRRVESAGIWNFNEAHYPWGLRTAALVPVAPEV